METFELFLVMAGLVLLSSIVDRMLPRVSPPLIQIGLGLIIALVFGVGVDIDLDPELFLVLFIAPLLFHDSRNANKVKLWQNRASILSLAIGLVVAIVFVVGFTINAIIPSIPLACAFMLGAALGPTDAVAVESLSRTSKLDPKERSMLQGECLINDASGVVSFQFAVAAAVTGTFSLFDATLEFIFSFAGGIAMGLVLAALTYYVRQKANEAGIDSITFHVLLDVLLPFIAFIVSEMIGVSGILAAVAAGMLTGILGDKSIGPNSAKLNIVTSSVWKVLSFTLNGLVFVLLGLLLPGAMENSILDPSINNGLLILYVLLLTLIITMARIIWVFGMNIHSVHRSRRKRMKVAARQISDLARRDDGGDSDDDAADKTFSGVKLLGTGMKPMLKSTLITTIGGPKGAITLSVIMSMPYTLTAGSAFPGRELMIFLASGTIVCTLLITNFLLPILAPKPKKEGGEYPESEDELDKIKVDILRKVISDLEAEHTAENDDATRAVIALYGTRIRRIRTESDFDFTDTVNLRMEILDLQWDKILELHASGETDEVEAVDCMFRITRSQNMLHGRGYGKLLLQALKHPIITVRVMVRNISKALGMLSGKTIESDEVKLRKELELCAIARLQDIIEKSHHEESAIPITRVRAAREQLAAHRSILRNLEKPKDTISVVIATGGDRIRKKQRYAYQVELDEIAQYVQDEKISRSAAKRLRDNVFLMLVELDGEI